VVKFDINDGREGAAASGGRTVWTVMPLELNLSVCKVATMTVRQRGRIMVDSLFSACKVVAETVGQSVSFLGKLGKAAATDGRVVSAKIPRKENTETEAKCLNKVTKMMKTIIPATRARRVQGLSRCGGPGSQPLCSTAIFFIATRTHTWVK
jgi:hypothetical protein